MHSATPSPLLQSQRTRLSWRIKCIIALALIPAIIFGTLIFLRLLGLFYPLYVPTGAMSPAIPAGDHIAMEGLTFLVRNPRRCDIVVFKSAQPPLPVPATFYIKRVVGVPGDHLSISNGKLFIDDKLVTLSNDEGKIVYDTPRHPEWFSLQTNATVPSGCYFLMGDNSADSLDSRFYGSIPRKDIKGLVVFCYWPPTRIGIIK